MKRSVVCFCLIVLAFVARPMQKGTYAQSLPSTVVLSSLLTPTQEPTKPKGDDKFAQGEVLITFNLTRDSGGNITAATADFIIQAQEFPKERQLVSAQVGQGPVGAAGPIVIDTGIAATPLTNGSARVTVSALPVPSDVAASIVANPNAFYFNIATDKNPNGAARGQLAVPPTVTGSMVNLKSLAVTGTGFQAGAVIKVNTINVHTKNDGTNPNTLLTSKKGGTLILHGQTVLIRVLNPDGGISAPFTFTRP
jgi:CHRD domain-containing protein